MEQKVDDVVLQLSCVLLGESGFPLGAHQQRGPGIAPAISRSAASG